MINRGGFVLCSLALSLSLVPPRAAHAQASQRGQPTTAFAVTDLAKLRWMEGTWRGAASGEPAFYERYRFTSDSTLDITYFGDSTLARETGTGRVFLSVGRIFHTTGAGRWGASHVNDRGAYFVPQVNAHTTIAWRKVSADAWTATLRGGLSGRERVTVFDMQRVAAR
ncbi:MAG: hypothetical protein ABJF01_00175 [bacterium]